MVHTDAKWQEHLSFIGKLYLDRGLTYKDIAERLSREKNFSVSHGSVGHRLRTWNMSQITREQEFSMLAYLYLCLKPTGLNIEFERFGEAIPLEELHAYMRENGLKESDDPLPLHLRVILSHGDNTSGLKKPPGREQVPSTPGPPVSYRQGASNRKRQTGAETAIDESYSGTHSQTSNSITIGQTTPASINAQLQSNNPWAADCSYAPKNQYDPRGANWEQSLYQPYSTHSASSAFGGTNLPFYQHAESTLPAVTTPVHKENRDHHRLGSQSGTSSLALIQTGWRYPYHQAGSMNTVRFNQSTIPTAAMPRAARAGAAGVGTPQETQSNATHGCLLQQPDFDESYDI